MKSKLFGAGGIDKRLRDDLDLLLNVKDQDLDRFGSWLSETPKPMPLTWSEIELLSEQTSVDLRTTNRVLIILRYLLVNWRAYDLTLDEIRSEFKSSGYADAQTDKIVGVLSRLKDVRERIYRLTLKSNYESRGGAVIDDVSILWDIRPVFQGTPYDTESDGKSYENLILHTHILLLEIMSSQRGGETKSAVYQLSEDGFDRLFRAFEKARRQLEIVKKTYA